MAKIQLAFTSPRNRLLARLPKDEFQRILPSLVPVTLAFKRVLNEPGSSFDYAYFLNEGVVSQLTVMEDGSGIEVATIGREGIVGVSILFGIDTSSSRLVVQVPGTALRMTAAVLRAETRGDTSLRRLLFLYNGAFLTQVAQAVGCNGLHSVARRCCRWLLMTHDRVPGDAFPITHDFLAQMLGVRRSSVTEVLKPLHEDGLIRYHRGNMTVLDRQGLEAASCECYRIVQDEFQRLFGD
jgi:CRP-like cAMP-binding protein